MLTEANMLAKNPSQTPPDLLCHGGHLPLEHTLLFIHTYKGHLSACYFLLSVEFKISLDRSPGSFSLHPSGTHCDELLHCIPRHWVHLPAALQHSGHGACGQELLRESGQCLFPAFLIYCIPTADDLAGSARVGRAVMQV